MRTSIWLLSLLSLLSLVLVACGDDRNEDPALGHHGSDLLFVEGTWESTASTNGPDFQRITISGNPRVMVYEWYNRQSNRNGYYRGNNHLTCSFRYFSRDFVRLGAPSFGPYQNQQAFQVRFGRSELIGGSNYNACLHSKFEQDFNSQFTSRTIEFYQDGQGNIVIDRVIFRKVNGPVNRPRRGRRR
jgi:hypothetical protein